MQDDPIQEKKCKVTLVRNVTPRAVLHLAHQWFMKIKSLGALHEWIISSLFLSVCVCDILNLHIKAEQDILMQLHSFWQPLLQLRCLYIILSIINMEYQQPSLRVISELSFPNGLTDILAFCCLRAHKTSQLFHHPLLSDYKSLLLCIVNPRCSTPL